MELEDGGGSGTTGSHWKIRNAQDELMAGVASVGYYTALTMAAFEDLGFYKADYSKAETMQWGRNAGCDFLSGKCVENNVTKFPSMYCDTNENVFRCQPTRLSTGRCQVVSYSTDLPAYYQYFTVPNVGGRALYYDYCPDIVRWAYGRCDRKASALAHNASVFNVFSTASRCVDGVFTPKDTAESTATGYYGMCANMQCDTATQTYSIQVYNSTAGYVNCTPGQNISLSTISDGFADGGYITCPPYVEVCQSNVQAAMDYEAAHPTPAPVIPSGSASSSSTQSGSRGGDNGAARALSVRAVAAFAALALAAVAAL